MEQSKNYSTRWDYNKKSNNWEKYETELPKFKPKYHANHYFTRINKYSEKPVLNKKKQKRRRRRKRGKANEGKNF